MERSEEVGLPQSQEGERPGAARRPASPSADPSLAPLLAKSPTLRAGLAQAERDDLDNVWGQAGRGTYLVPREKIVIDENAIGQGSRIARSLSHEIGHHLFTEGPDRTSKQSYVNSMLRGEAAATLSNVQVQREIVAAGGPDMAFPVQVIGHNNTEPLRRNSRPDGSIVAKHWIRSLRCSRRRLRLLVLMRTTSFTTAHTMTST